VWHTDPPPVNKPIRKYDFKHPQRVSKDQQRTLENLHTNLAQRLASDFSTIQRSVVDCDIAFVDQTTYAEFIMSLSNPSCSYTFTVEPMHGPVIVDFHCPSPMHLSIGNLVGMAILRIQRFVR
jgi:flagellar motor switch protein FliM